MVKSKFNLKKRSTGVWLDKEKAIIVTLHNGDISVNTLLSNVEHFHVSGGSGTRLKGGPQDVIQDSKYLEREKLQLKTYFKNIASEIKDVNALVLFGPAEIKDKFNKELSTSYKDLSAKVKDVVTADSMTTRQVKAWVKAFYKEGRL
jgi:stalled ribosome rescue protein Dom34